MAAVAIWAGSLGLAAVLWAHLFAWLSRRTLGDRYDDARSMAERPPSAWTDDERDSGVTLTAAQLRLALRVLERQAPVALASVALLVVGHALG